MFLADSQKIQCTTCKHKKHHCDHVKFVEEMASSTPDADLLDAISEFLTVSEEWTKIKNRMVQLYLDFKNSLHSIIFTGGGA